MDKYKRAVTLPSALNDKGDELMKSKKIHQDVYISIAIYVALLFLLTVSIKLPEDSAIFPNMLIGILAILNTSVLIKGIKKSKDSSIQNSIRWEVIRLPLLVFLMVAIYSALFKLTNYFIATSAFMIGLFIFFKVRSWKIIILVTMIFNALIYLGFSKLLNVPLL